LPTSISCGRPFSTLWFIYLLPVFFVVTKLARDLGIPPFAVWLASAALQSANIATGHTVIDEFASRYFFFYTGFAPRIFAFAANAGAYPETAIAALATWGFINGVLVFNGFAELPAVSLALGLAGAGGVVCLSALFAQTDIAKPLRFCGRNSIVIYLAFFLPMAITRTVIINTKWIRCRDHVCDGGRLPA
jgi:uncharacterized membrane protein YcfT